MARPRKPERFVVMSVAVEPRLDAAVRRVAEKQCASVSDILRALIKRGFRYKKTADDAPSLTI